MAHINHFNADIQINPTPRPGTSLGMRFTPLPLRGKGLNIAVEISTSQFFVAQKQPRQSITLMGHLDTGASLTTIDNSLASHLGLVATGSGKINTAGGTVRTNNYAVDIAFLGTELKNILNLQVSSCQLAHFDLNRAVQETKSPNPSNFGLLIGRDIMSLWNIVWHGPSSTVFISD
jgi:hypothetical protein